MHARTKQNHWFLKLALCSYTHARQKGNTKYTKSLYKLGSVATKQQPAHIYQRSIVCLSPVASRWPTLFLSSTQPLTPQQTTMQSTDQPHTHIHTHTNTHHCVLEERRLVVTVPIPIAFWVTERSPIIQSLLPSCVPLTHNAAGPPYLLRPLQLSHSPRMNTYFRGCYRIG